MAPPHFKILWEKLRRASWLPAIPLLFVQLASGMREMPQMAFFLIYMQEELALTPLIISTMVSGSQVVGMLTALVGGGFAADLGKKRVLLVGLFLSGLSSLAFQTPVLWLAALLWMLGGAGMALVTIGAASYLTHISARGALGILAAFYALSMTAGGALGNPLAGVLIEQFGYAAFSWTAMGLSAVMILVVISAMIDTHDQRSSSRLQPFFLGLRLLFAQPKLRLLSAARCLPTIFYGMLTVLIPLLLYNISGSKVLVAAFGTASLVVASVAQLLAGRLADRWGARLPTYIAYSLILFSGLGLGFTSQTLWGLFVFGVLGNSAAWSLSTMMYVWVNDGIPKPEHPPVFGLLHAVWSLSMIAGSLLGGWFVTRTPGLPFLIAGLLNLLSFFLVKAYYQTQPSSAAASARTSTGV